MEILLAIILSLFAFKIFIDASISIMNAILSSSMIVRKLL